MARKVFVKVKVNLILDMEEGIDLSDAILEMDYNFKSETDGVDVYHTEIADWEITDSK